MQIQHLRPLGKASYLSLRASLRKTGHWTDFKRTPTWLEERAALRNKIREMADDGKIAVYEWARDCDMCESSSVRLIPASVMAYQRFENAVHDGAEGPCCCYIVPMNEVADFELTFRDRIAEAWDNGNTSPYMV